MSKNVIKLADTVDDVRFDTVHDVLRRALDLCEPGGVYETRDGFVPTKVVIVLVDEHGEKFHIKALQSAGKLSETVALLDIAKQRTINDMYGIPP
jgi:hypothetical protein